MRKSYIDAAVLNADKSLFKFSSHGAVVIYRGKIVGNGFNKHTVEKPYKGSKYSTHAEVDAINNALRKISVDNLRKSTLIVVRVNNLGEMNLSYPCKYCQMYINKFGLKSTYYS